MILCPDCIFSSSPRPVIHIQVTSLAGPTPACGFLPQAPRPQVPVLTPTFDLLSLSNTWNWEMPPVSLPEESHGQRSLPGYSPWDHKESDTTERLTAAVISSVCAPLLSHVPLFCPPHPPTVDCSPPDSSVPGIPQARIPEWIAFSSSRVSS